MTDPGPFAPPSGALTPRPVETAPAASVLPPPIGQPIGTGSPAGPTFPIVPPPPPRRRWLVPVIVGGSLVLVALLAGVGFAATQVAGAIAQAPFGTPPEDEFPQMDSLLRGDPGAPVAAEPLACEVCFDLADARSIALPGAAYSGIGVPVSDNSTYEATVGADQIEKSGWWIADGGTPDACYFTYTNAPLYVVPNDSGGAAVNDDVILYPDWHSDADEFYLLTESVRVFDSTSRATTHLAEVETAVAGCPSISFPDSGWSATVTPTPALDLPASVAAYGWVESNDFGRYFAVELQRGNLIARITLSTDAYGATESEFRAFTEEYAAMLAELEPTA